MSDEIKRASLMAYWVGIDSPRIVRPFSDLTSDTDTAIDSYGKKFKKILASSHEEAARIFKEWLSCGMPENVKEAVDHPEHYGGKDNIYEVIKVIEAWALGFNLGNTVKYISRAPNKGTHLQDLKKARWYLDREIANLEKK